jgi:hypothetical protein
VVLVRCCWCGAVMPLMLLVLSTSTMTPAGRRYQRNPGVYDLFPRSPAALVLLLWWWCGGHGGVGEVLRRLPPPRHRQDGVADTTPVSPTSSDALWAKLLPTSHFSGMVAWPLSHGMVVSFGYWSMMVPPLWCY